jgi:hypothetical protein
MENATDKPTSAPSVSQQNSQQDCSSEHIAWITGRVETLLSHFFQPDQPAEVTEAAIEDWVSALAGQPIVAIDHACRAYLKDNTRRRPVPSEILARALQYAETRRPIEQAPPSPVDNLTPDETTLLANKILPKARQWLDSPDLCKQGAKTLAFWNDPISVEQAMKLRHRFAVVLPAHEVAEPQRYLDELRAITSSQQPDAAPEPDPIEDVQW